MSHTSRLIFALLVVSVYGLDAGLATAQNFPTKTITIVVPNTPGNPLDLTPRLMAPEMSKVLGVPVIVENKPGAGTALGTEYVAKQAPADGYTILLTTDQNLAIFPVAIKDLRFDPLNDIPPFIALSSSRLVLASAAKQPWKTFDELIAYAKANPGKLNYGSASQSGFLNTGALVRARAVNIIHVPFQSTEQNILAVVKGDDIHVAFLTEVQALTSGAAIRPLVQTGDKRSAAFPDVPTVTELGLPRVAGFTFTMNARAGTPKAVIDKLYSAASQAFNHPEMKAQITNKLKMDVREPPQQTSEAATKSLMDLAKLYAGIAKELGMTPQ